MAYLVFVVLANAGAVMLLISGFQHVPNHRVLLASMLAHGVLPYGLARAAARGVPLAQLLLGAIALAAFATTPLFGPQFGRWASAACCCIYLVLSVYVGAVLVSGKAAECVCFGRAESVTWFSLMRTAIPAASFGGVLTQRHMLTNGQVAVAIVAGCVIAALAIVAPHHGRLKAGDAT